MIITYDIEVFKYDWLIVFKIGNDYQIFHNNLDQLRLFIKNNRKNIFVGFNNYHYDDMVLAGLLLDYDPFEITNKIINNKERVFYKLNLITLDVIQELPLGVGLKSSQANLGLSIVETPVDFNLDRPLSSEELKRLIEYCKNDTKSTEEIFNIRKDYFQAKFEIIKEFNLDVMAVKKTRAILASKVLQCQKVNIPNDRLTISYDPNLDFNKIPREITDFFKKCEYDFKCGVPYEEIENRKLNIDIAGVKHTIGFGGLHGAIEKYNGSGTFLQIDVSSYYPSLIINNNFISRASRKPELYKELRDIRFRLKKEKNPKEYIYKILLNATFGAMKSKYNSLYDPKQSNDICINGQLILIQLIKELEPYCQLIQSNTDGIVIKYNNNYELIENIIKDFGKRFNLGFDIDKIVKIAQRDVNNYAIQFDTGKIKAKGRFSKFNGGSFEQNTLSIIDKCLVNYYIHDIPIYETIIKCYQENDLMPFQIVCKMGSTYQGMYYEYGPEDKTEMLPTQKVNRVFATSDKTYWGIYKRKENSYQKIANTSENNFIHNEDISNFDKSKLDLNYYINLCNKNLY